MPHIFFTQFWIALAMGRMSETFVQELHVRHWTGMRCIIANTILLVSFDAHVFAKCRSTGTIQHIRCIGIANSMVSCLYLYGARHHVIGQNCLHYGHISVHCVNYFLLSRHHAARSFARHNAFVHTAMGIAAGSCCLVGGGHANILFAWIGIWRLDCIQVCCLLDECTYNVSNAWEIHFWPLQLIQSGQQ